MSAASPSAQSRDLLDDLNLLLWEADPETLQFTYVSRGAEQMLGYSLDRWLKQPAFWADLLHPDDRDAAIVECRQALIDCRDHTLEYRMVASDGRVIWVRDVVRVICNDARRPVGLRGVMIDITERKHADQAIERHEGYFRTLVRQTLDIVTVVNPRGVILYESPSAGRILGYEVSSRIGRSVFDLVHPDDQETARIALDHAFVAGQTSSTLEFRLRHADGHYRILEAIGHRFAGDDGQPLAIINSRDATERRRLDDRLNQAQKMDALSRLTGSMAHDFGSVLDTIVEHTEAAALRGPSLDVHQALVDIRQAAEAGADLTRQLLDFSRRSTSSHESTDAVATLLELRDVLTSFLGQGIALEIETDGRPAPVSLGDGVLEHVMTILAANARDAMPWGGMFRITARRVSSGSSAALVITASDSGVGMSLHVRSRIFEPFFTTKAPGKGIGLGLATVYGFVQNAGGDISVESDLGRGTTFTITLPIR